MIKVLLATANGGERETLSNFLLAMSVELNNSPQNGSEAIDAIRTTRPDICIIDLILPENSGLDVLKSLQALQSPPITLLLSPITTKSFLERSLRLGASDILQRPFSAQEFVSTILHCIDRVNAT